MGEFASKGVAGAGLGLGIAGTALALLKDGGLGDIFSGGGKQSEKNAALMAENAQLKAEKYTDSKIAEVYMAGRNEKDAAVDRLLDKYIEPISKEIADMRVREAVTNARVDCLGKEFKAAIELESERRTAGDQNLYCYVNATFVPGKLVMPKDSICPPVMPQYNSWTAPTTTTTTTPTTGA